MSSGPFSLLPLFLLLSESWEAEEEQAVEALVCESYD